MVLKDCSRCMVYTPQGKPLCEASVTHTRDYISLYFDLSSMRDIRMYTTVDFYDDRVGLVRAICELVVRRNPAFPGMPQPWMAECVIKEVKDSLQRQKDIRAKVHIETSFASERHGAFYGVIENISAGGLYVVTRQPLDRNEKISFQYTFRTAMRTFQASVIRGKRMGDEYGYGCCFVDLNENAEAVIREYVYKVLKERDKKRRSE
ncbi:MAG: PilZ domain-containing protein [Lachnospiraceae bacterium]|nr:PilZ domain-containing protein [Lachnospiraceae bacterium]